MKSKKQNLFITLALGSGLTLASLWLLNGGASQVTLAQSGTGVIRVATTGSDTSGCGGQATPCLTVQYAVDQAQADDEIQVAAGTYTGVQTIGGGVQLVYISKTVTIRGGYTAPGFADPPDPDNNPTVLDAEGQGRVIYINGSFISPTIEGLWITGGNASHALVSNDQGGGIYSYGADPLIVSSVIIYNVAYTSTSSRGYGGGIYVNNAPGGAVISGSQVISNVANTSYHGYGGGIYVSNAPGVQLINNAVLSNTGTITGGQGYAGGIYLSNSSGAIVDGNRIEHNVGQQKQGFSGSFGGGIYCYNSDDAVFSHNTVRHNIVSLVMYGGYGGGICASSSNRVRVEGNTLEGNQSTGIGSGWGGGLMVFDHHDLLLSGNRILSNSADRGGGLYISGNATFTMTNNIVAGNVASSRGGGLAFNTSTGEMVTGTLLHNTFAANNQGSGEGRSAIHTYAPDVSLILTNNLIYSHTYGVIVVPTSTVWLYNTLFHANDSDTSGAGEIHNTDPITGQDPLLDASYRLGAGSPAIDAGVDTGVSTDIDGDPRPLGDGYDIGADEFAWRHIYLPLVVRNY